MVAAQGIPRADSIEVIGIELDGKAYAVAKEGMILPEFFAISLIGDENQAAITYDCYRARVRVFIHRNASEPVEIGVAGITDSCDILFSVDGEGYLQNAKDFPLEPMPFSLTSLAEWRSIHPETLYFAGELSEKYAVR